VVAIFCAIDGLEVGVNQGWCWRLWYRLVQLHAAVHHHHLHRSLGRRFFATLDYGVPVIRSLLVAAY
jgi:hypothetical protein